MNYLGKRHPSHLAMEGDTHPLHDPVVFDRSVEVWRHCLGGGRSHYQLSIFCDNFSVCDLHDIKLNLLNGPLLNSRQMKFLEM